THVVEEALDAYAKRETELGSDVLRQVERSVMLSVIDNKWREHLSEMDYLRAGIGVGAMGPEDPLSVDEREGPIVGVPERGLRHVHRAGRLGEPGRGSISVPGRAGQAQARAATRR